MSFGATDELLLRGVGAARDGAREDARFYLEWALRDDPTTAQFAEAWYWLSRVAESPKERRRCLGQVLGAEPTHAEARRDLAILDGRIREGELIDPARPLAPLTPGGALAPGEVRRARCPTCGGALVTDAARGDLICQFCGSRGTAGGDGLVEEADWEAAIHTARGHRRTVPSEWTFACQGCGATLLMSPGAMSGTCAFCGSAQIVTMTAPGDLIAPEGVIPFGFDAGEARRRARAWLRAQPFRPDDLDTQLALAAPRAVYLPFWTFDIEGEVRWQGVAEDGHGTQPPLRGGDQLLYDDVLVPGGGSLPAELLAALEYDTGALVPYAPELLAGWPAELYRVPPADASLSARERVIGDYRRRLDDRSGQEVEDLTVSSAGLAVVAYKLVLLPVWVADYRYKGEDFRLVVNGQSGHVHGDAPRGRVGQLLAWMMGDKGGGAG